MDSMWMLTQLLEAAPHDVDTQRVVCELATKVGDIGMLAKLAGSTCLDADVVAKLGDIDDASVRLAWISNPERSADEVAAKVGSERRSSVIEALAGVSGLPRSSYEAVAKRCRTIRTRIAFVAGPAPLDLRCAVLDAFVADNKTLDSAQRGKFTRAIVDDAGLGLHLLSRDENPGAGLVVSALRAVANNRQHFEANGETSGEIVSDRIVEKLTKWFVDDPVEAVLQAPAGGGSPGWPGWPAGVVLSDAERVMEVLEYASPQAASHRLRIEWGEKLERMLAAPYSPSQAAYMRSRIEGIVGVAASENSEARARVEELRDAAHAGSEDAVRQLAALTKDPLVAEELIDDAVGELLCSHSTDVSSLRLLLRLFRAHRALAFHAGAEPGTERFDLLIGLATKSSDIGGIVDGVEDRHAVVLAWARLGNATDQLCRTFETWSGLSFDELGSEIVDALPVAAVQLSPTLAAAAALRVRDRFGADPAAWKLFDELGDSEEAGVSKQRFGELFGLVELTAET